MAGSGDRVVARRPRLLSHADVLHAGVGEEAFLEYLGESPGGERGVHPPEGQELAPGKGRLEVLADGGAVLLEEAPVGVGQGPVGIEDLHVPAGLLEGVVAGRDAPPGHARQVRDLLDQRRHRPFAHAPAPPAPPPRRGPPGSRRPRAPRPGAGRAREPASRIRPPPVLRSWLVLRGERLLPVVLHAHGDPALLVLRAACPRGTRMTWPRGRLTGSTLYRAAGPCSCRPPRSSHEMSPILRADRGRPRARSDLPAGGCAPGSSASSPRASWSPDAGSPRASAPRSPGPGGPPHRYG
jgi:hypothetical protein